jgi:hypothetical protein
LQPNALSHPFNGLQKLTTPHYFISLHYIHSFTAVSFLLCFFFPPHRTTPKPEPHAGCKVIRSLYSNPRQVDAPNQCSSANKAIYVLLWYWHTCIAQHHPVLAEGMQVAFLSFVSGHLLFLKEGVPGFSRSTLGQNFLFYYPY